MAQLLKLLVVPENLLDKVQRFVTDCDVVSSSRNRIKQELMEQSPDIVIASHDCIPELHSRLSEIEMDRPTVFAVVDGKETSLPSMLEEGLVDDILTAPLRGLDVLSRLRWHHYLKSLREVESMNVGVEELVAKLEKDILFAQKIQRSLIKEKFPLMPGLCVRSKYWSGLRSGGDYFDVFELPNKRYVGFLLTDVSSYALSSALMKAILHLPVQKLGFFKDPCAVVLHLYESISSSMKEKDCFSIFYGVLDRKDYVLQYVNRGDIFLIHQDVKGQTKQYSSNREASLTKDGLPLLQSSSFVLEPKDRLVISSDGLEEVMGVKPLDFLKSMERRESQELINEFAFALNQAQSSGEKEKSLLPQDCSLLLVDVAKHILRLAQ